MSNSNIFSVKKGFALPIIILVVLFITGTIIGLIYFLKTKDNPITTSGSTQETINSPKPDVKNKAKEIDSEFTPRYLSNEKPDREIDVVAGGFNLIDFNLEIKTMTSPTILIDKGKQNWMFLQTQTPSKKTNAMPTDTYFHSVLGIAPPKDVSGSYDLVVIYFENNIQKFSKVYRINVLSKSKSTEINLPPVSIKAALIGVGFNQSIQDRVAITESDYYEATGHQGKLQIEYLGNVTNSVDEVFVRTDEIIDPFIISKGKSTTDYDLALVFFNSSTYGGAYRTDGKLKKITFCCRNDIFLHEFIHLASGVTDISHENTLLPPDPLHYSSFEISKKYSNPTLIQLGFEPNKKGVWLLVDNWGYKKITKNATYKIIIRNTGAITDKIKLNANTLDPNFNVELAPASWVHLSESEVTLEPYQVKNIQLSIDVPASAPLKLYGLTINATSELDKSVWDKANFYFETSK